MEPWLVALRAAFEAHLVLNAAIAAVLLIGFCLSLAHRLALGPVQQWVDQTSRGFAVKEPPALLAPLARLLAGKERGGLVLALSAMGALRAATRRGCCSGCLPS